MRAPAQLDVLLVHEQLAGEAAELAERLAAYRKRRPACCGDVLEGRDVLRRLAEATRPGEAAHVDDGAARVEQLLPVEQTQPRHRDSDPRLRERFGEAPEGARDDHRVRVEKNEHVPTGLARAAVGSAR